MTDGLKEYNPNQFANLTPECDQVEKEETFSVDDVATKLGLLESSHNPQNEDYQNHENIMKKLWYTLTPKPFALSTPTTNWKPGIDILSH